MTEHTFIRSIHKHLPAKLLRWKIHDTYAGGVPDAFYGGPHGVMWVEYKFLRKLPVRTTTRLKVNLSPLQIQWLARLNACGQTTKVIVGHGKNGIVLDNPQQTVVQHDFVTNAQSIRQLAQLITNHCLGTTDD